MKQPNISRLGRSLIVVVAVLGSPAHGQDPATSEFFEKKIRPILAGTCFPCHGGQKVGGGLRIDSRVSLSKGGESGPALELEAGDQTLLLKAIRREADVSAMPPGKPLSVDAVADLTTWVKAGAHWPETTRKFESNRHWAFEQIKTPLVPTVIDKDWCQTSVDSFVLAKLETSGRHPARPADMRTLLRRVTFDLTGLPPTFEETRAFLADNSERAYETVIDRLLNSPHYGEHMGRHWLDVVRYADTAGENSDHPLPHAWRYRNWVIDALNRDMPYNQFVSDQIAGDILARTAEGSERNDKIIATGYLAIARRFGHEIDKDIHLTIEDTIDSVGKTFLGLTIACSRCHDHKYDPITARDYYGLYGIFESTKYAFPGCEPQQLPRDLVPLSLDAESEQRRNQIDLELKTLDAQLTQLNLNQARSLKELSDQAQMARVVLSTGEIGEGKSAEIKALINDQACSVHVKPGEVILLAARPLKNHGADSTRIELEISEKGAKSQRWSVMDLVTDLEAGNPHADTYQNPNVWSFLDLKDSPTLLSEGLMEINGRKSLRAWRNGDTPSVFVNISDRPVSVWTELPPKSFFVHPGPNGPVGVAWTSQIDGELIIQGKVTDAHVGGLDGVGWTLEHLKSAGVGSYLADLGKQGLIINDVKKRRTQLESSRPAQPLAYAVQDGAPCDAKIHLRGDPATLGEEVPRKFLEILGGRRVVNSGESGRLDLAKWLTDPSNPLTARVLVNRVWQWHFGQGIVATANDFGTRGTPPTHPELLDHLANELIRSGWSLKWLHRQILLSATYRQQVVDSTFSSQLDAFTRRRLSAEEIRDMLLAVSGQLDLQPGQAHPFPPESSWSFTQHGPFTDEYPTRKRSLYVMQKRNRRARFFTLFDGADPNASTPKRDLTTVPTQALFFMNDPFFHECANGFAERITREAVADHPRVETAYHLLFGRDPHHQETRQWLDFLMEYRAGLSNLRESARDREAFAAFARILLGSNEAIHVD